jgi:hypothetical protein
VSPRFVAGTMVPVLEVSSLHQVVASCSAITAHPHPSLGSVHSQGAMVISSIPQADAPQYPAKAYTKHIVQLFFLVELLTKPLEGLAWWLRPRTSLASSW